jgi:hypothetical protein
VVAEFVLVLLVLAVAIAIGLAIFYGVKAFLAHQERMRQARLDLARRLGLAYEPTPTEPLLSYFQGLQVLPKGHRQYIRHVFRGLYRGLELRCFEYVYVTRHRDSKGNTSESHHPVAVAVGNIHERYPRLTMVPEHLGHKLWDALGGDDIDFESAEFSRKFWVKCDDRKFAYDLVHARAMDHLLAPGWRHWEVHGGVVCLSNPGRLRLEEIPHNLDRLLAFVEMIPSFRRTAAAANPSARPEGAKWEGGWWHAPATKG